MFPFLTLTDEVTHFFTSNTPMTQKVRNSNLELYRIITMLAIVSHHYVVNSGLRGGGSF